MSAYLNLRIQGCPRLPGYRPIDWQPLPRPRRWMGKARKNALSVSVLYIARLVSSFIEEKQVSVICHNYTPVVVSKPNQKQELVASGKAVWNNMVKCWRSFVREMLVLKRLTSSLWRWDIVLSRCENYSGRPLDGLKVDEQEDYTTCNQPTVI